MNDPAFPSWVEAVSLPFGNSRARLSDDWQACAAALGRVVPLEVYEPLAAGGPYRHRCASLDLGSVQAVAVTHSDIHLRGRRCSQGRSFLRIPLTGSAQIAQQGRTYTLAAGSACFDCDDSSSYEARTERSGMLVLSLEPRRIARAAALLRSPSEDPDPYRARLPEQRILDPSSPAVPLLIGQIRQILSLADADDLEAGSAVRPRLAELLERAVALMLFPELIRPA